MDVPVQVAVPLIQTVQRMVEVPLVQYTDGIVDVPVEIPLLKTVEKVVEIPQLTSGPGATRYEMNQAGTVRQTKPAR